MNLVCGKCGADIDPQHVNIATDLAKCENCNSLFRASELSEKVALKDLLKLPAGSKLQLEQLSGSTIQIVSPRQGFNGETIGLGIFSIFWLGFIFVWTSFTLIGGSFFALFSIPFWVVGFFMAYSTVQKISTSYKLVINDRQLTLETSRLFGNKHETIPHKTIEDIVMYDVVKDGPLAAFRHANLTTQSNKNKQTEIPAIITPTGKHFFFESAHEYEQRWLVKLLKHIAVKKPIPQSF